ncbi:hypothetical protein AZI86_03955 [Bdellovibrio bacteriovorus]|uniref:Peptidase S1 domain-containing protein n=1 Tax=Bdellovibrio bacteriovorus TaxID=959 RepID=A0A150WPV4_BDEBC|nr:trypsin-like serine protease [Bdellovibrio bacteriovorus]KYG66225.1 hypothetical protein AZI86_03955 [Bdellovibrio bacteriovorus]
MKKIFFASLFVLAACQEAPQNHELGFIDPAVSADIIRGNPVPAQDKLARTVFMLVSTDSTATSDMDGASICTASALTSKIAITAAHCVQGGPDMTHRLHVVDEKGVTTTNKVLKFKQHEEFIPDVNAYRASLPKEEQDLRIENHDIAILLLENELPASTIYPHLPESDEFLEINGPFTKLLAVGFGRVTGEALRDGKSGILRQGEVEGKGYNPERMTFEIDQSDGKSQGICTGDSGGPSFLETSKGLVLVGIAYEVAPYVFPGDENPDRCLGTGHYVNVQSQLNWILNTSEELLK